MYYYFVLAFLYGWLLGMGSVASNPAPYYAAIGLVVIAAVGSGTAMGCGGGFLGLALFMIYLGGMLVVFAYSAALAAEPYPESWGSWSVLGVMLVYAVVVVVAGLLLGGITNEVFWVVSEEFNEFSIFRGDTGGVAMLYSGGGGALIAAIWVLLLTLFVVLELTRGSSRGTLRAV